jgi:hypothetical protein
MTGEHSGLQQRIQEEIAPCSLGGTPSLRSPRPRLPPAAAPSDDEEVVAESDDDSDGEWEPEEEEGEESDEMWSECSDDDDSDGEWEPMVEEGEAAGSVEEERMFSAMKFLKNAQRNRLLAEYLTAAARLFKDSAYGGQH